MYTLNHAGNKMQKKTETEIRVRQRYGMWEKLVGTREERARTRQLNMLVRRLFAVIDFTDFPPEKCSITRFQGGKTFIDFSCIGPDPITEPQIERLFETLKQHGFPAERKMINSHVMGTFSHSYAAWTIGLNETQLNEEISIKEDEIRSSCCSIL